MSLLEFLSLNSNRKNPFGSEDYYDRNNLDESDYSPKELSRLQDTRDLGLGPVKIADGVAISPEGYFSAVLQVGTVNFALATADEQEAIIGGYHAVLRQLAGSHYQIKVRMVEADLEPLAARVDYALSSYTSASLHRLALQYKQFLREELPRRLVLMERRNYVIATVHSPLLVKMGQLYERETGKPNPIFAGLGSQWRASEQLAGGQGKNRTKAHPKEKKGRGGKNKPVNPAEERRAQLLKARADSEMEDKMYEEVERTLRRLKHELSILVTGLSANGLALRRLNDWELTALYAEYLRPELAQEVRHSLSAQLRTQLRQAQSGQAAFAADNGWYGGAVRPLSLAEFMGEQSGTVVVSDLPEDSPAYEASVTYTQTVLSDKSKATVVQSDAKNTQPEVGANKQITGSSQPHTTPSKKEVVKRKQEAEKIAQPQPSYNPTRSVKPAPVAGTIRQSRQASVPVPSFKSASSSEKKPTSKVLVEAQE